MKRFFQRIWKGWKRIAHAIGVFQTKVIITLFYFLIIGMLSILVRLLRRDLLDMRMGKKSPTWHDKRLGPVDMESCKHQF